MHGTAIAHDRRGFLEFEFAGSWTLLVLEVIATIGWSIVTGVIYHRLALNKTGDIAMFAGTGVLVSLIVCCGERLFQPQTAATRRSLAPLVQTLSLWCFCFLVLSFLAFSFQVGAGFSRGAVLAFFFTGPLALLATRRLSTRLFAQRLSRHSLRWSDAVLIGSSRTVLEASARAFQDRGCATPLVVSIDAHCGENLWREELARSLKQATAFAHRAGPGAVYICAQDIAQDRFDNLLKGLQQLPRAVRIIPDLRTAQMLSFPLRRSAGGLSIEVQAPPMTFAERAMKRMIDLVLASISMLLLLPLMTALALVIFLDSPGPAIFRQTRLGSRGRPFKILKFRSMRVMEDGASVEQAHRSDGRVTRIGAFLRRTSLDELPQLLNVIRGEMSLVGPRPHALAHDREFAVTMANYELRQHVKPGLTGWAQVNGLRGETTPDLMRRRVEADIWYAKNASLGLDCEILLRTVLVVLGQENAY